MPIMQKLEVLAAKTSSAELSHRDHLRAIRAKYSDPSHPAQFRRLLKNLHSEHNKVDEKGFTVYHYASPGNAESIKKSGKQYSAPDRGYVNYFMRPNQHGGQRAYGPVEMHVHHSWKSIYDLAKENKVHNGKEWLGLEARHVKPLRIDLHHPKIKAPKVKPVKAHPFGVPYSRDDDKQVSYYGSIPHEKYKKMHADMIKRGLKPMVSSNDRTHRYKSDDGKEKVEAEHVTHPFSGKKLVRVWHQMPRKD